MSARTAEHEFENYPDLAARGLAGSVIWATDESFAERENLINDHEPAFDPELFGNKGKVYDGWETRRRRGAEIGRDDAAIVRLGVPGHIRGVIVDTSWFTGNFPTAFAVLGTAIDEYLPAEEIAALPEDAWFELVGRTEARGDARHAVAVDPGSAAGSRRVTHVKLVMIPDGGIARLRVHGVPAPDPRFLGGTVDLAAIENGGRVVECSNMFYSSPNQMLSLGRSRNMGGGWENARRRDGGNDHVTIALAGAGVPEFIEVDTSYFVFNAPGEVAISGWAESGGERGAVVELVGRRPVLPDTRHRFAVAEAARGAEITHLRIDVFPDGGLARLRVHGRLTGAALADLRARWDS